MLPLLGLYADVYKGRNGRNADAYAFIEPIKSRLFPATFDYVHRDLDGVETTTRKVLFGDLVAAVEEQDGNCLFRAMSRWQHGTPETYERVRQEIVKYMRCHREGFESFATEAHPNYEDIAGVPKVLPAADVQRRPPQGHSEEEGCEGGRGAEGPGHFATGASKGGRSV